MMNVGTSRARNRASNTFEDEQLALRKCLLFMSAFRAVRRIMPMQHAYAFLLVALQQGRGVQEYAESAGVSQAVMTRILFALGSRGRGRERGYGLVQQGVDPEDARKHQTFLTAKGKTLMREIARMVRSETKMRSRDQIERAPDIVREQWLSKLITAGRELDLEDTKLAVQLIEALRRQRLIKIIK